MLAIIAAITQNGVIGKNGKIPWDFPKDRKHFQKLTMGQAALPGRMNYIISSTLHIDEPYCVTRSSLADVLKQEKTRDIYICGGQTLYEEALPSADKLYLTEIPFSTDGDTFFPAWDKTKFRLISKESCLDKNTELCFMEYARRP